MRTPCALQSHGYYTNIIIAYVCALQSHEYYTNIIIAYVCALQSHEYYTNIIIAYVAILFMGQKCMVYYSWDWNGTL